jgi:site-specific recombinase XerD
LLFGVGYYCGLRISEALQLKMDALLNESFIEVVGKMNIRRKVRVPNIIQIRAQEYSEARAHK